MRKALYIMGFLNDFDTEWLADHGTVQQINKNAVLISEGREIDSIYILLDGRLSVIRSGLTGEVARLSSGEILGEISFVDSRPPVTSVIALEDSQVFAVRRDILKAKLADDMGFAARFYQAIGSFLADRLRSTVGQLGYGNPLDQPAADDLDDVWMESVSFAASRFDRLLQKLGVARRAA